MRLPRWYVRKQNLAAAVLLTICFFRFGGRAVQGGLQETGAMRG